ncbi:MAG: MBL fold metallo-hydrolase [Pseudomonadota bacterium]
MLRVVVFDVSNGNCALAVDVHGHSLMLDCGSHLDKPCPVDRILELRRPGNWLGHMRDFVSKNGVRYPLTKLSVSHPDLDHIKNAEKVHSELKPYLLHRRYLEDFPSQLLATNDPSFGSYKKRLCDRYRHSVSENPDWGFRQTCYSIPTKDLTNDKRFADSSFKNNSSYVYMIEYVGHKFLFSGDLEEVGWEWLLENNPKFLEDISSGVSVLIASHHGHRSGYSQSLMNVMGSPILSVLSKGTERGDGTDVDSRYSLHSDGMLVKNLAKDRHEEKYTLTTRSNGSLYFEVDAKGYLSAYSQR